MCYNIIKVKENKNRVNKLGGKQKWKKRRFEVGKTYTENDVLVFEVVKRTAKFLTYVEIRKYGKYNETREEPKRTKIHDWDTREVFFASGCLLEA